MSYSISSRVSSYTELKMSSKQIPTTGHRTELTSSLKSFLKANPGLHLGGDVDFHQERRHHLELFGWHNLAKDKQAPIGKVEFTAIRGPHGTIPIRLFYPQAVIDSSRKDVAALVYMHGGGYTVGSVDEFENGLRLVAEAADVVVGWTRPACEEVQMLIHACRPLVLNIDSHQNTTFRPS